MVPTTTTTGKNGGKGHNGKKNQDDHNKGQRQQNKVTSQDVTIAEQNNSWNPNAMCMVHAPNSNHSNGQCTTQKKWEQNPAHVVTS